MLENQKKKKRLGEEKTVKTVKMSKNALNYVFQWYLTGDQKNLTFISQKWMLLPSWKTKMKETTDITLIISKYVTTIFDDRFDIIAEYNSGTFKTISMRS